MIYFMLCNVTPETREKLRQTPNLLNYAIYNIGNDENRIMSAYATVGLYDMIAVAETKDLDSMALMSLEFGNLTDMNVISVPSISIQNFEYREIPATVPTTPMLVDEIEKSLEKTPKIEETVYNKNENIYNHN